MSSSPSPLLLLQLMADGEDNNSWGDNTNVNLVLIEDAVTGSTSFTMGSTNVTLTDSQYSDCQSRYKTLTIAGALTADCLVIVPARAKEYLVNNQTSGPHSITVISAAAGSTGVAVKQNAITHIWCDGTNVNYVSAQGSTDASTLNGLPGADYAQVIQRYADFPTDAVPEAQSFIGGQAETFVTLVDGATITLDCRLANKWYGVIAGNRIMDLTNPTDGQSMEIWILEDVVGGRTLTWPGNVVFQGGTPAMDTTASHLNRFKLTYNGTSATWAATADTNFAATAVSSATINSSLVDTNLFQYLGSPGSAGTFNITIAAGVVCRSTNPGNPALDMTGFASGSIVNLINLGYILGTGGDGGGGAACGTTGSAGDAVPYAFTGKNGKPGGDALKGPGSGSTLNVTNASGFIWGGGGGGGGGGASGSGINSTGNGGGGGGGAGGGRGGDKGTGDCYNGDHSSNDGAYGSNGPNGTFGTGGAGVSSGGGSSAAGANGGDWGAAGTAGGTATLVIGTHPAAPGNGGAAGKAINVAGGTVNFVSGSSNPHVKGNVA